MRTGRESKVGQVATAAPRSRRSTAPTARGSRNSHTAPRFGVPSVMENSAAYSISSLSNSPQASVSDGSTAAATSRST